MAGRKKKADKADTPADNATVIDDGMRAAEDMSDDIVEEGASEDTATEDIASRDYAPETEEIAGDPPAEEDPVAPEPGQSDSTPLSPGTGPEPGRQSGFFAMLLGGVAAAVVGFAVAKFVFPESWPATDDDTIRITQEIQAQSAAITALQGEVTRLSEDLDLNGLQSGLTDQQAQIAALADRLASAEDRVMQLEARPAGAGVSGAALAAYENRLTALRAELDAQRESLAAMNANAAMLEKSAEAAAQDTLRRATLTRIQTALETGTGYAAALADLKATGVDIPEALSRSAVGGVASMTDLLDTYPDAARNALQAARATTSDGTGGFAAFLRTQLGARSLEPREGDDPDAVLSRVEAAARDGRLTDALAELEALPDAGRAHLSDWADRVAERLAAMNAMQQLSDALN